MKKLRDGRWRQWYAVISLLEPYRASVNNVQMCMNIDRLTCGLTVNRRFPGPVSLVNCRLRGLTEVRV
jgi:hypothetical protein